MKSFDYKLQGMRKAQNWIVYPRSSALNGLRVQSDKSCGILDLATGEGFLNTKSAYFPGLTIKENFFTFPPEFVKLAIENEPTSGSTVGGGVDLA